MLTLCNRDVRNLACCGIALLFGTGVLAWLSTSFAYGSDVAQRPILPFVGVMTAMFVVHWVGYRIATQLCGARDNPGRVRGARARSTMLLIWGTAIGCRLILIPTHPIQEIDLYRYVWDGEVTAAGVSPFRFPPARIVQALNERPLTTDGQDAPQSRSSEESSQLAALTRLCAEQPGTQQVLRRIHYAELPTVYPMVSQIVFAAVARVTPPGASVGTHVVAMKIAVVIFDLLTIASLFWLLRLSRVSPSCAILYAWNPLVLKEFAGSGHLDSIAVFCLVTAAAFAVRAWKHEDNRGRIGVSWLLASACLAFGFGAKLFPIFVLPLFVMTAFRASDTWRTGLARATAMSGAFAVIAIALTMPLLASKSHSGLVRSDVTLTIVPTDALDPPQPSDQPAPSTSAVPFGPPLPLVPPLPAETLIAGTDSDRSVERVGGVDENIVEPMAQAQSRSTVVPEGFVAAADAVDLVMALDPPLPTDVIDASSPDSKTTLVHPRRSSVDSTRASHSMGGATDGFKAFFSRWQMNDVVFGSVAENVLFDRSRPDGRWYCFAPRGLRQWITREATERFGCDPGQASFLLARVVTAIAFAAVVAWTLVQTKRDDAIHFGRMIFLTIAVFWLLCPTLNPWYWTWALPFLAFARSRGWWLVSGLLVLYYVRFWLDYHPHGAEAFLTGLGIETSMAGTSLFDEVLVFVEHLPWMVIVLWETGYRYADSVFRRSGRGQLAQESGRKLQIGSSAGA